MDRYISDVEYYFRKGRLIRGRQKALKENDTERVLAITKAYNRLHRQYYDRLGKAT